MSDIKTIHDLRDTDHRLLPYTKEMGCGIVIINRAIVLNSYYWPEGPWAEDEKAVGKLKPAHLRVVVMIPYGCHHVEQNVFCKSWYKEHLLFWNTLDGQASADCAARILSDRANISITGERNKTDNGIHVFPNAMILCGERVRLPPDTHKEQFNIGAKKFGHAEVLYRDNKHLH